MFGPAKPIPCSVFAARELQGVLLLKHLEGVDINRSDVVIGTGLVAVVVIL